MATPEEANSGPSKITNTSENPFLDPAENSRASFMADTLAVGNGKASLTIGASGLTVLDEDFEKKKELRNCCGVWPWPSGTANTRQIPFYNVLWAEIQGSELTINYASPASKQVVRAASLKYTVEASSLEGVNTWIRKLLERAYGKSQLNKRMKVLVNPHSGPGYAEKWYHRDAEPLLKAAHCVIDMAKTSYGGEATEIAEKLDIEAFDVIAGVSGDGLLHEVFNGLGKRPDARKALAKIAVVNIPGGSGNAMSWNLTGTGSPSLATLAVIKGTRTPLDLISITQGDRRTLSFLSQSLGIVAESDLATEHMRWMGGMRFTVGFLTRLAKQVVFPCELAVKVAIDDKPSIKAHYKRELENHESENERRGYKQLLEDDASASSGHEDALPPLKYGTVNDKLPDSWEQISYENMGNFYSGNMAFMSADANFFPAALPNDGYMDLVTIDGDISRLTSLSMMFGLENRKFFGMPLVRVRKILGYRITPKNQTSGYISIDGESIPFEPFQAEVHKGLGTILVKSEHRFEALGPL